jgi:hypothetical protein
VASRSSTDKVARSALLALALSLSGCATVRPDAREFLADPAMTFGSQGVSQAQEEHVLSNREGSFGAGGVSGGGCGCN